MDDQTQGSDVRSTALLDERKAYFDAKNEQSQFYDKAITTLAGGALALSLVFIRDCVPEHHQVKHWLVLTAWLSFCTSLILTLASFLTSQQACQTEIDNIDEKIRARHRKEDSGANHWLAATVCLNWLSIFAFVGGAVFLALFAYYNLR